VTTNTVGLTSPPPILVIGLGNRLLSDDGVGIELLERLRRTMAAVDIEFLDGSALGVALCPLLANRAAILVLDAVSLGAKPGTIHMIEGAEVRHLKRDVASNVHGTNAAALIAAAMLLGDVASRILVIGIEPRNLNIGVGLSDEVMAALEPAQVQIAAILDRLLQDTFETPAPATARAAEA